PETQLAAGPAQRQTRSQRRTEEPMKAWLLDSLDGIDRLRLSDAPDPRPAAGEVVLRLHYAALNPADRYLAEGQYPGKPAFPHVLGRDGIGEVIAIGAGVTDWKIGAGALILRSDIGVNRWGTFAERVAVPAEVITAPPSQWRKKCRDFLGGGRVDLSIDNIGGALFSELLDVLGENAKVAVIGRLAGPVPQFNTASLISRRITIRGVFVGSYKTLEAQQAWN